MWVRTELHTHTTVSDGRAAPEEVVAAAATRGVHLLAITDHHALDGYRKAKAVAAQHEITVLPGVELSCPSGRRAVHVLAVFPQRKRLARLSDQLRLADAGIGNAKGVVPLTVPEAVERIHELGGLAIAAHARADHGLLRECEGPALQLVADRCRFDAIELAQSTNPHADLRIPPALDEIPVITGSDAHRLHDHESSSHPYGVGAHAFWAQMDDPGFSGLAAALRAGNVSAVPPWLDEPGPARLDTLLALDRRWVRYVPDDSTEEQREQVIAEIVDLLNGDGGHVLVGVRPRFRGATRGAPLTLSLDELHEVVVEAVHPTPILRTLAYRGPKGGIHEFVVLPAENPGRGYAERTRGAAVKAARADRHALIELGALQRGAFKHAIAEHARRSHGVPDLRALRQLFPYRDWYMDDSGAAHLIALGIVAALSDTPDPPRWLVHWARETDRVRRELTDSYRTMIRRDQVASHRERVQAALIDAQQNGTLTAAERRRVAEWWERGAASAREGDEELGPGVALAPERLRRRGARVFGAEFAADLDDEARRVREQYDTAMRELVGSHAAVVLDVGQEEVPWDTLQNAGIDVPRQRHGARDGSLRRSSRSVRRRRPGRPPRPMGGGRADRRRGRAAADTPHDRGGAGAADRAVRGDDGTRERRAGDRRPFDYRPCAASAPRPRRPARDARPSRGRGDRGCGRARRGDRRRRRHRRDEVARGRRDLGSRRRRRRARRQPAGRVPVLTDPGTVQQLRGPALVLAGLLGERTPLRLWPTERTRQIRLAMLDGIGLLGIRHDEDISDLLIGALQEGAGLTERAARILAEHGEPGYETLRANLPDDARCRAYAVRGVAGVADRAPAAARAFARAAAQDLDPAVLAELRQLDQGLYLDEARRRFASSAEDDARRACRNSAEVT